MKAQKTNEICLTSEFYSQSLLLPRNVSRSLAKTVLPRLRDWSGTADPPAIKKLRGWKELWRYRIGDHRHIYRADNELAEITLQMVGPRSTVYDQLGHVPDKGPPLRVLTSAPQWVEEDRAQELEVESTQSSDVDDPLSASPAGNADEPLPRPVTERILEQSGIERKFWDVLTNATTTDALLALAGEVPDAQLNRVLSQLFPPSAGEMLDSPRRVIGSDEEFADAIEEGRSVESFLLKLDPHQRPFVERFRNSTQTGPWIVKGGPGTGKSTMALYCIHNLLTAHQQKLFSENQKRQILFTTYTKSLVSLSEHLLGLMGDTSTIERTTVKNVDQLAYGLLPNQWRMRKALQEDELTDLIRSLLTSEVNDARGRRFSPDDAEFLADEIDWVIFGNALEDLDSYRKIERKGRKRSLAPAQREQVWRLYSKVRERLGRTRLRTFKQSAAVAGLRAKPKYDYVFIDEAQDLTPSAIRMCVKLCKSPKNVLLTADLNQSIYGNGISWSSIDSELSFRGRSVILKRNYRNTGELCKAISFLSEGSVDAESQLAVDQAVFSGEPPVFVSYEDGDDEAGQINRFLRQSILEERLAPSCAAVLCPTKKDCDALVERIDPVFNAKAMRSKDVTFEHRGVKVMTLHASKGLEFPVVVVARANERDASSRASEWNAEALSKRLLLVACSRAIRRLMVSSLRGGRLPILKGINGQAWEVWD